MIEGHATLPNGLVPAPGGAEEPRVLERLRLLSARLRATRTGGVRMMVEDGEVVGTIGFKGESSARGEIEIGYGVAATRRRRGHAKRAVEAILAIARADAAVRVVIAETVADNVASQGVLAACGFQRSGTRFDPDDGEVIVWRHALDREAEA